MLPLRDDNPASAMPITTVLLIGATVAVWWSVQGGGLSQAPLVESICRYGVIPVEVTGFAPADEGPCALGGLRWEAMPTSVFLHGGWMHLIGNMWFLWVFGDNVEDAMGPLRFLAFYLIVGVLAAGAQILATPASALPMVGASGALSGVMGAYLVLYPRARVDTLFFFFVFFRVVPIPAWLMLGYWILLQVFASTLTPEGAGGVAYMAHIGGFAAGIVLLPILRDREKRKTRPRRKVGGGS